MDEPYRQRCRLPGPAFYRTFKTLAYAEPVVIFKNHGCFMAYIRFPDILANYMAAEADVFLSPAFGLSVEDKLGRSYIRITVFPAVTMEYLSFLIGVSCCCA